jgi:FixJ family two-component response regulator
LTRAKTIIAIVDDDMSMLTSTARLLTVHGFGTQTFVSAEAFLNYESAARPDCLILDINLGGISGIEMGRRLTAAGSLIPVIFITALDDKETFRQANEAGCVAYIHKPCAADVLIGAINEAIAPADAHAPIALWRNETAQM